MGDVNGEIVGSFTIPANVPAGTKTVRAEDRGGTTAQAMFTGQGVIEIDVMRRTTISNVGDVSSKSAAAAATSQTLRPRISCCLRCGS